MNKTIILFILTSILAGCSGDRDKKPNIILVSIDTLRWDYLSTYGYPDQEISPTVNWLAENGTVFDQAVASAGTTLPSHGTMLTGLYPRMHGARSNFHAIYPETKTIAQELSNAGYQTGAFVSINMLLGIGKMDRGFQHVNRPFKVVAGKRPPLQGSQTINQAAQWLDTLDPDKPAFLWLHLWEPHGPYDITEWARGKLADYDGFLKNGATTEYLLQRTAEIRNSEKHVAALQTIYSGEVNLVDQYLGQFFEDWKSRDLLANTVVIFTADHGQGLGERKKMGHGATHAEHVIRVPMILSDFRSPEHRRVQTRIGTIDISPTIAELAGLEQKFDWIGSSMLHPETLDPEKPYFAEVELRTSKDKRQNHETWYDPNAVGVWSGDYKLVFRKGNYQMYETQTDNRFPKLIKSEEEPILFDYLAGLIETFQQTELDLKSGSVSEEQLRQLQGLGYVQ